MTTEQLELEVRAALPLIGEGKRAIVGGREVFTEGDLKEAIKAANSFWNLGMDLSELEEEEELEDEPELGLDGGGGSAAPEGVVTTLEEAVKELEVSVATESVAPAEPVVPAEPATPTEQVPAEAATTEAPEATEAPATTEPTSGEAPKPPKDKK